MSQAGLNLKYLRKTRGWTQEEFANKLNIKRSLIGAYEEERADPRLEVMEIVSDMFKISLDELLRKDLSESGTSYWEKRRNLKLGNTQKNNLIHFVPVKAAAGYLTGYADNEFLDELNTFTLPMLTGGNYRAFEIIGDSMLPTPSGSIIVGEKLEDINHLKSNTHCIVVSMQEGIVYKRVVRNNRTKNKLTLESDNPAYNPYQINISDVAEIWVAQVVIGKVADQQRWDVHSLAHLVNNLQSQVFSLSKKIN
jgi:transcriptional regulator with XRE-family HTH domain